MKILDVLKRPKLDNPVPTGETVQAVPVLKMGKLALYREIPPASHKLKRQLLADFASFVKDPVSEQSLVKLQASAKTYQDAVRSEYRPVG